MLVQKFLNSKLNFDPGLNLTVTLTLKLKGYFEFKNLSLRISFYILGNQVKNIYILQWNTKEGYQKFLKSNIFQEMFPLFFHVFFWTFELFRPFGPKIKSNEKFLFDVGYVN